MSKAQVLIVDPDVANRFAVVGALEAAGYGALTASGPDLETWISADRFDLVILKPDPGPDGLAPLQRIRGVSDIPVILIGLLDDEAVLAGLTAGADDCLRPSTPLEELLWRMRAVLRRSAPRTLAATGERRTRTVARPTLPAVVVGPLRVDFSAQKASFNGETLDLTPIELHLLDVLARNVGRLVPREVLSQEVWGVSEPVSGSLDIALSRLRKKLTAVDLASLVKTVRGVGYLLSSELASMAGETATETSNSA